MPSLVAALAALFVILGVPILFLSLPAAGIFFFVVPIWIVVTSVVIGAAWLVFGRYGVLTASGVFIAIVAWTAARAVIEPRIAENTRCSESAAMTLLPPRITRPARVVFDDFRTTMAFAGKYPLDLVAVVTGAEVVEIDRLARGHIGDARSTKASPGPVCTASGSRNTIQTSGSQPQRLDLCLTRTELLNFSRGKTKTLDFADAAPTITFAANADDQNTGRRKCDVIDIYEEEGGAKRQLGRFVYDWRDHKLHPDPRKPGPGRSGGLFTAIIRAVLGEQVSEDALKQHFVY
jgi:hypothetical protein